MPAKHTTATSRTTGISGATINAGAAALGSEIDNSTNLDTFATAELLFTPNASSVANEVLELFALYAVDGTNYEDGGAAVRPKKTPVAVFPTRDSTAAERIDNGPFLLLPFKVKFLLWNAMTGQATSVTLKVFTHNVDPSA